MASFSTAPGSYVSHYTEVTSQYVANTNGTGYNAGDVIQKTQTFNPATTPPTVLDTVWSNLTQQTTSLTAPPTADIDPGTPTVTKGYTTIASEYLYNGIPIADYAVNDIVQAVSTYDNSVNPAVLVNTVYNNISQGIYDTATGFSAYDLVPIKNQPYEVITNEYIALVPQTGWYAAGDVLEKRIAIDYQDRFLPTVNYAWYNVTQQIDINALVPPADVYPANSPAAASTTDLLQNNLYYAIANSTTPGEYSIGDVLEQQIVLNTSTVPPAATSIIWKNLTTGNTLAGLAVQAEILPVDTPSTSLSAAGTVTNQYLVITGTPEADPGDVVEEVIAYDLATTPPTPLSSKWTNVTNGVAITVPNTPPYNTLAPFGSADANTSRVSSSALYIAQTDSTPPGAYVVGDIIERLTIFNTNEDPPTTVSEHFDNLTTGGENIVFDYNDGVPLGGPIPNPAAINSLQFTTAITPAQFSSLPLQNGVVITADADNLLPIYIGGDNTVSSTNGYKLLPGQSISYGVSNLNGIWFLGQDTTSILYATGN